MTNFGGYFNTKNVLRAFGRRALNVDGTISPWQPTAVPIQVLTNVITKTLVQTEKEKIRQALAPGGADLTASDLAHFSPTGQAAYHLLKGDEPDRVEANIEALSAPIQAQLEELSPSRVVDQIRAPIFLLHDRNDTSIPFTESRDFAAALARINHPYQHVEFGIFDHVQVRSHLDTNQLLIDGSHLFTILSAMLFIGSQKG